MGLKAPYIFYKIVNVGDNEASINEGPDGEEISRRCHPEIKLVRDLCVTLDTNKVVCHQGSNVQERSEDSDGPVELSIKSEDIILVLDSIYFFIIFITSIGHVKLLSV